MSHVLRIFHPSTNKSLKNLEFTLFFQQNQSYYCKKSDVYVLPIFQYHRYLCKINALFHCIPE